MSTTTTEPSANDGSSQSNSPAPARVADEPLREPGKRALEAEREARQAVEAVLAETAGMGKPEIRELVKSLVQGEFQQIELLKAQAAAKAAEERAAAAELRALQSDIAAEFGISNDDRDLFLTGVDKETLTRQATALQERSRDASPRTPKPDLTQGRGITSKATTEDQFAAFFAEAFPH